MQNLSSMVSIRIVLFIFSIHLGISTSLYADVYCTKIVREYLAKRLPIPNTNETGTYIVNGPGIFFYTYRYEKGADGLIHIYELNIPFSSKRTHVATYKNLKQIPPKDAAISSLDHYFETRI